MLLNELFSSALPWEWEYIDIAGGEARATFSTNDTPYYIAFYHMTGKTHWIVEFGVEGMPTSKGTGITGSGQASMVLATVIDCIRDFVKQAKPVELSFSATEPSRQSLYRTMIRRLGYAPTIDDMDGAELYTIRP